MGANQGVGIGLRLFQNRVIHNEHGEIRSGQAQLGLPNQRFGVRPDLARIQVYAREPAHHLVVAEVPIKEP